MRGIAAARGWSWSLIANLRGSVLVPLKPWRALLARQSPVLASPGGGCSSQERVSGCYVPGADELERRSARARAGDGALGRVGGAGKDLLVHVGLARLAQCLEGRGVAAALSQAVPAVPERVRARSEPRGASIAAASRPLRGADGGDVGQVHASPGVELDHE